MRVVVLGAGGRTGALVTSELLSRGHDVVAVLRDASGLAPTTCLTTVEGDALDPETLRRALVGAHAVVSTLGRSSVATEPVYANAASVTIEAMRAADVDRLVVVSTKSVTRPEGQSARFAPSTVVDEMRAMEHRIMESGLTWTILRPTALSDAPTPGRLTRTDLACEIADVLENTSHLREAMTLEASEG